MRTSEAGWFTVEEAARAVNVSVADVREWCRDGSVETFREGPFHRYVKLEDVRLHVRMLRGEQRTSLHGLLASYGRESTATGRVSELQGLVRERMHPARA